MLAGNTAYELPGDYESIATVVVGSGGASTITFDSIPQTFQHLQIRGIARNSSAGPNYNFTRINLNNNTGSDYAYHLLRGDGTDAASGAGSSQTFMWSALSVDNGVTSNIFSGFVIDILDYTNTNKNTTVRSLAGYDANGSGYVALLSGLFNNTAAITEIDLTDTAADNFAQYSSFSLYGIK
jgi:hypothetical protein